MVTATEAPITWGVPAACAPFASVLDQISDTLEPGLLQSPGMGTLRAGNCGVGCWPVSWPISSWPSTLMKLLFGLLGLNRKLQASCSAWDAVSTPCAVSSNAAFAL